MARGVFSEVNGVRLHHLDHGGTGPVLVCLHGLTRNAHDFDALAARLTPRYRVLALDVRGRGESAWAPPESYQLPQYASDLLAWLDANDLERVPLIGTSMGGLIALFFGARHPERLAAAVLNDVGPVVDRSGLGRIQKMVAGTPEQFPDLEAVVRWFRSANPPLRLTDADLLEWARHATRPLSGGGLRWHYDKALRDQMRGAAPAAVQIPDLWGLAEALPGPTLVVRGGISDLLSAETAAEMTRRMKSCQSVEVPGVGHAPSLVEPEALSALEPFLASAV